MSTALKRKPGDIELSHSCEGIMHAHIFLQSSEGNITYQIALTTFGQWTCKMPVKSMDLKEDVVLINDS